MTDLDQVVEQAIEESVNEFERGVKFHDLTDPKTTIPDGIINWLKTNEDVKAQFRERLKSDTKQWDKDRKQVCKAAFDAGALAAFYVFLDNFLKESKKKECKKTEVSEEHVRKALKHISTICKVGLVGFGGRYIYCPWQL